MSDLMEAMRDGYGKALCELVSKGENILVLDADVSKSTRTNWVEKVSPEKFINMGISEQDMVGTAAGLALGGVVPFATTYSVFLTGRAWDQIRTTVCYGNLNVKLAGAHAGISVGPDGATHQALEDVALMKVLPNMTVVVPCDSEETRKATHAIFKKPGPCYIRFGREPVPMITTEDSPFVIGKANVIKCGKDVAIIANGSMVFEAIRASEKLELLGYSAMVINMHTVKPLDKEAIIEAAKETGCIVTAEEHQISGGMGSSVAEVVCENNPVPLIRVGIFDTFGESGSPSELMEAYGLNSNSIINAALKVIGIRNKISAFE